LQRIIRKCTGLSHMTCVSCGNVSPSHINCFASATLSSACSPPAQPLSIGLKLARKSTDFY
jgi:hypothetical protein